MNVPDMKSTTVELDGTDADDFVDAVDDSLALADAFLRAHTNDYLAAYTDHQETEDGVTVSYDYLSKS